MIVPVEITWVTGQVVTAAQLNANIRDAINFLLNPPTCELRQTVAQSVNTAGAVLLFDVEELDNDNMHSTVSLTSRATAQTPGRYGTIWGVGWSTNATGRKGGWLLVNGANAASTGAVVPSAGANETVVAGRGRNMFLNSGDYMEVFGYQEAGVAVSTTVANSFYQSSFSLRYAGTT